MGSLYHLNEEQRREAYLMASRNPYLLWRLQAFRAGHVPPLSMQRIPRELLNLPIPKEEDYHVEPLIEHAKRYRKKERKTARKVMTVLLLTVVFFFGFLILFSLKDGQSFQIGLVQALFQ